MIVIIFREHRGGQLEPIDTVNVADTAADPESAAWAAWTRSATRDVGAYSVARAGKRFGLGTRSTPVTTSLGDMTAAGH